MQYIELSFVENYVMFVENALSVDGYPSNVVQLNKTENANSPFEEYFHAMLDG